MFEHLWIILDLLFSLNLSPEDLVDFLAVLTDLSSRLYTVWLFEIWQVLNKWPFFGQSGELSSLQIIEKLDIHMSHFAQFRVHTLSNDMNIIDAGLHTPNYC